MDNSLSFGIDFGTTNTSVFLYYKTSDHTYSKEYFGDPAEHGAKPFPSVIAVNISDMSDNLYGIKAKQMISDPDANGKYIFIRSFKTGLDSDREYIVAGKRISTVELVAQFLAFVKASVNEQCASRGVQLESAVFTVPVDFSSAARTNLMKAAECAGIQLEGYLTESTAAYLSKVESTQAFSRVLSADWGGGTLDLSVLELRNGTVREAATWGIAVGGDTIDEALARYVYSRTDAEESFDNYERRAYLYERAERMKIDFSTSDEDMSLIIRGKGSVNVTYEQFCDIVDPIIQRDVLGAINKVMKLANVVPTNIDAVILAGGSSSIRRFAEAMENIFGTDKLIFDDDHQWMVARGAAYFSAIDGQVRLADDVCVLMSDDTVFPLLSHDSAEVGGNPVSVTFSLTDDSDNARFIFVDSDNVQRYGIVNVRAKGYLDEQLTISARIDRDQTARIRITNRAIGADYAEETELRTLRFYYDVSSV